MEPPERVPTAAQVLKEAREFLAKQKVKELREEAPKAAQVENGSWERFALEIETASQKLLLDYLIIRQKAGGVTLAGRLLSGEPPTLRAEVERIARSVVLTPRR